MPTTLKIMVPDSRPATRVIRRRPRFAEARQHLAWQRLVAAWVISGIAHLAVLAILMIVPFREGPERPDMHLTLFEPEVQPAERRPRFDNEIIGRDSERVASLGLKRVEGINVIGPVDLAQPIGMPDQPIKHPISMPLPRGLDGEPGQGLPPAPIQAPESPKSEAFASDRAGGVPTAAPAPRVQGFDGRSGAAKDLLWAKDGGTIRSEAAVAAGLNWLARHQEYDGHWGLHDFGSATGCNCNFVASKPDDCAGTALALLPFLAAGETHSGTAWAHRYSKPVERGLKYLISRQSPDGGFGNMYDHTLATIALCEACGMTNDPMLQRPAQRAVNYLVAAQHFQGGWRYSPRTPGDTSVTGWCVQALKSAQLAGLKVPYPTLVGVNAFLDSVASDDGSAYDYDLKQKGTPALNAVGLLSRQYMGWTTNQIGLRKGILRLQTIPPSAATGDIYYCYYATQVMHHAGGEPWQAWNVQMREQLIDSQDQGTDPRHAHQKGSWSPQGDYLAPHLGRLGYTSLCLLTLEVYYRYLPLYRPGQGITKLEPRRGQ